MTDEVGSSGFLVPLYEMNEKQVKGCAVKLKVNGWRMDIVGL